jgi:hypothetical protein
MQHRPLGHGDLEIKWLRHGKLIWHSYVILGDLKCDLLDSKWYYGNLAWGNGDWGPCNLVKEIILI